MTSILIRRPCEDTRTPTYTERTVPCQDGDRMESRVHKPRNTKYCWQSPEARREAKKDSSLDPSKGKQLCWHHDFGLVASTHFVGWHFGFWWCPLRNKAFWFWWSPIYLFSFVTCATYVISKKSLPNLNEDLCFLLRVLQFYLFSLGLQSILNLFLYMLRGEGPSSVFFMGLSRCPSTTVWKDCSFFVNVFGTLAKNRLMIDTLVYL